MRTLPITPSPRIKTGVRMVSSWANYRLTHRKKSVQWLGLDLNYNRQPQCSKQTISFRKDVNMTKLLFSALTVCLLAMPVLAQTAPAKEFGATTPAATAPATPPVVAPTPATPAVDAPATPGATTPPAAPKLGPNGKPVAPAAPAGTVTTKVDAKGNTSTFDANGKRIKMVDKDGKVVPLDKDGNPKKPSGFGDNFLFIMIGMIALMIFMSSRGKKKQKQKQQDMMTSLKKGDRVVSIGGIVGTIVEVKDTEIVIKISDTARMRMAKWAIRAAGPEAETDQAKDSKDGTK